VLQVTVDEILDSCEGSCADDWAFWVYVCGDDPAARPRPQQGDAVRTRHICARAVHLVRGEIGLAWTPAEEEEVSYLAAWSSPVVRGEHAYHWVELVYEGTVVDRQLAVWIHDECVSLPVPGCEPSGDGRDPAFRVSRRAYRLIRLANEIDADCADFDACFARSGIELR
jgi:hypothetical protein